MNYIGKLDFIREINTVLLRQSKLNKCTAFENRPDSRRAAVYKKLLKWKWIKVVEVKNGYTFVKPTDLLLSMKIDFPLAGVLSDH